MVKQSGDCLSVTPIVEIGQQTCYAKFAYITNLPKISPFGRGAGNGYELADGFSGS
jgi:hypothetical protein